MLGTAVGIERGLRLLRSIVLAKMIAPDQIGLVALCALILALFETASETGIRQSVIQNKQGDRPAFLNASWWIQSGRGIIITLLGMALSGWFCGLLNKPEMTRLLMAAFAAVAFNAMVSPASYLLERQMRFGRYVVLQQGSMLLGTVLTIVVAFFIPNAWAMIIGIAAEGLIKLAASFVMCPFMPRLPIDRQSTGALLRFGRGMMGLPLLSLGVLYGDVLILGRMQTSAEVGYYGMAALLARMPRDLAMQIAGRLLLPAFAAKQEQQEHLRQGILLSTRWLALASAPLAMFITLAAAPILTLAFRPEYTAAANAFALLGWTVFFRVQGVIFWNYCVATHHLTQSRYFVLIRAIVLGGLIVPLIKQWGLQGAAAAALIGEGCGFVFQAVCLVRTLNIGWRQYAAAFASAALLSCLMAGGCYGLKACVSPLSSLLDLTIGLVFLLLTYAVSAFRELPNIKGYLRQIK